MTDVILPDGSLLADLIANLNVFSSNPATSQGEGEIIYNSTDNNIYKNTGTTGSPIWVGVGIGLLNIVEDTTPQLGGDLDGNAKKITGVTEIQTSDGISFDGATKNYTMRENDTSHDLELTIPTGKYFVIKTA